MNPHYVLQVGSQLEVLCYCQGCLWLNDWQRCSCLQAPADAMLTEEVGPEEIATVVSRWTGGYCDCMLHVQVLSFGCDDKKSCH
jgi:hypothetical protein